MSYTGVNYNVIHNGSGAVKSDRISRVFTFGTITAAGSSRLQNANMLRGDLCPSCRHLKSPRFLFSLRLQTGTPWRVKGPSHRPNSKPSFLTSNKPCPSCCRPHPEANRNLFLKTDDRACTAPRNTSLTDTGCVTACGYKASDSLERRHMFADAGMCRA